MHADFSTTNLEGAILEDTDLRGAKLQDARLNETVFTDVRIDLQTAFGTRAVYETEGTESDTGAETHPLRAAAWMYRELQQVHRDNSLPERTRESYRYEKDARRRLAWAKNDYATALKRELSRWVMLYGSSPYRILVVSAVIIVFSAVLYPITGGLQVSNGEQVIMYHLENPTNASRWWLAHVFFRSLYFSIVTIRLNQTLTQSQTLVAALHRDTNNQQFDPPTDKDYTVNGQPVLDAAVVRVTANQTTTPAGTTTAAETTTEA